MKATSEQKTFLMRTAAVLLLTLLTATTAWADDALSLGENTVTFVSETVTYTFMPTEDGDYRFYSSASKTCPLYDTKRR